MSLWHTVEADISRCSGRSFRIINRQRVGGGSINNAYRVTDGHQSYFVKTNRQPLLYMFEAEARGIEALYLSQTIRVPQPIACGVSEHECYFIMDWLNLSGQPSSEEFGRRMAALHGCHNSRFGFAIDNTIGSTPQLNQWSDDWVDFWQKQRLGYQLGLARENGLDKRLQSIGLRLQDSCSAFFSDYQPRPSLLHGDLWSGNWSGDEQGNPVIFDPATYYGDREADLAMMELFGHPGRLFFDAYNEAYALDPGYGLRKNFYNLYHILNHANLFGGGYTGQALGMMESLLAELR